MFGHKIGQRDWAVIVAFARYARTSNEDVAQRISDYAEHHNTTPHLVCRLLAEVL